MPLDLVALVTSRRLRVIASSKAYRITRSQPFLENTACWIAHSMSVPSNMRPPTEEYSPSLFSRTIQ